MKLSIIRIVCYLALLGVVSCASGSEKATENLPENADMTAKDVSVPAPESTELSELLLNSGSMHVDRTETQKKIIKDGSIVITTKDLDQTKRDIDSLVKRLDGYYGKEKLSSLRSELCLSLIIRVPNKHFEALMSGLESGSSKIDSKEIIVRDVTDQFIDIETRLANKRSYLTRYRELLKQARNITEILEVEEKIRTLEEEIESAEGTLSYLSDQVTYSSLNLKIFSPQEVRFMPEQRARFIERLKAAFFRGWYGFVDILLLLFHLWPFWLIIGAGVWVWILRGKRKAKRS